MSVTKMEVGRDVIGGLGSKSKKWELVVRDSMIRRNWAGVKRSQRCKSSCAI